MTIPTSEPSTRFNPVPTLIYFVNGAVRAKIVGMVSPKAILAKLNSLTPGNPPANESERPQ